jgi:hypothetical protein
MKEEPDVNEVLPSSFIVHRSSFIVRPRPLLTPFRPACNILEAQPFNSRIPLRRRSPFRIMKRAIVAFVAVVSLTVSTTYAQNASPRTGEGRFFPVSRIAPGLKGYGMSVFQGSSPERFDVEVLGVLEGVPNPRQRLIIARLSGPNVARTRVFAGMSGSPVYFDGKLAGAIAYSFPFSTEPLAGITPIEQMDAQLRDAAPQQRISGSRLSFSDLAASRQGKGGYDMASVLRGLPAPASAPVGGAATTAPQLAAVAGQQLQPIATPLAFSGFPQSVVDTFAADFQRLGIMPVVGFAGGGGLGPMSPITENTLRPGSSVTVQLVRGDYQVAASGTVTDRDGERILAFGHPFLSLGATNMPMAESSVVVVVPSVNNSWKLSQASNLVGAIGQDRSSGIGGKLGQQATMIPVRVSFTNSLGETQTFNYEIISDPNFAPLLTGMTLMATLNSTERQQGDQTIDVKGRIQLDGQPEISLENRFSGASSASSAAAQSIATPLAVLLNSGFKGVAVRGIDVTLSASEERNVGTLTRVVVDRTRVARGRGVRADRGREAVRRADPGRDPARHARRQDRHHRGRRRLADRDRRGARVVLAREPRPARHRHQQAQEERPPLREGDPRDRRSARRERAAHVAPAVRALEPRLAARLGRLRTAPDVDAPRARDPAGELRHRRPAGDRRQRRQVRRPVRDAPARPAAAGAPPHPSRSPRGEGAVTSTRQPRPGVPPAAIRGRSGSLS